MGSRAKLRAAQRTALKEHSKTIARLHAEAVADPEYQARQKLPDEGVLAVIEERKSRQVRLLQLRGWAWRYDGTDGVGCWDLHHGLRLIHSVSREPDGEVWSHLSVSRRDNTLPDWYEVRDCQWLLYPDLTGLIVVAPGDEHVNVAEVAHVWTKLTGDAAVPDFRKMGSI
jgi:hypothetical protein